MSVLTDNANRAIQGNVAMQVTQSGGHLWKQCKYRHLVAKCATNASGAIWWPNLQLMQVAPSGGQICNECKWCHVVAKLSLVPLNPLGLCWKQVWSLPAWFSPSLQNSPQKGRCSLHPQTSLKASLLRHKHLICSWLVEEISTICRPVLLNGNQSFLLHLALC